jgi:hypothetical protein
MNPPIEEARSTAKQSAPENKLPQQANHSIGHKSTSAKKPLPKQLGLVRRMSPLAHWPDRTRPFDIARSQVVEWLTRQPDVLQWLFQTVQTRKLILFDRRSRTWHGADCAEAMVEKVVSQTSPVVNFEEPADLLTEMRDILVATHNLENEQLHVLRSINSSMP